LRAEDDSSERMGFKSWNVTPDASREEVPQ